MRLLLRVRCCVCWTLAEDDDGCSSDDNTEEVLDSESVSSVSGTFMERPLFKTARIVSLAIRTSFPPVVFLLMAPVLVPGVSPPKCFVNCVIGLSLRRTRPWYMDVLCKASGETVVGCGVMMLSTPIDSTFSRILIDLRAFCSRRDKASLLRVARREGRSTGAPMSLRRSNSAPDASKPEIRGASCISRVGLPSGELQGVTVGDQLAPVGVFRTLGVTALMPRSCRTEARPMCTENVEQEFRRDREARGVAGALKGRKEEINCVLIFREILVLSVFLKEIFKGLFYGGIFLGKFLFW